MGLTCSGQTRTSTRRSRRPGFRGIDGKQFVKMLFREHGIQVAGGQGEMTGKIFRIGHCGYFDAYDIIATIAAAELALESLGYPVELGRGVGAAQRVFSKSGVAA